MNPDGIRMNRGRAILALLRPQHWIKNFFVLAPLIFSFSFLQPERVAQSFIALVLFSLTASNVYILNDLLDIERDRQHPVKKNRPLASGQVSLRFAKIFGLLLCASGLILSFFFSKTFFSVLVGYLLLNTAYSIWLKHLAILDLFAVALSLVLRVLAGIVAIGVSASPWIFGTTFFIGLYIVSLKRSLEFEAADAGERRPVLKGYTASFLQTIITFSLILTLVFYIFYSILVIKETVFLITALPVAYGMLRLLQLMQLKTAPSDNPVDVVIHDKPIQYAIVTFALLVVSLFLHLMR